MFRVAEVHWSELVIVTLPQNEPLSVENFGAVKPPEKST